MLVRLTMSMPLPTAPTGPVAGAASYFVSAPAGVVIDAGDIDAIRAHPAVVRAGLWKQVGDVVPSTPSGADRVGYALLSCVDRDQLEDALAFVRRTWVVRTQPD
jgi:hypothetical protein